MSSIERKGDWVQTYSGRCFYPLDPRPEDVTLIDIAHALSNICRFGGHCVWFYSVAEHSVHLSTVFKDRGDILWALLHDAPEAYLCDVPRPLKRCLSGYAEAEAAVMAAIATKFGLTGAVPEVVKAFDSRMLATERLAAMRRSDQPWKSLDPPLALTLKYWTPEDAKAKFLAAFSEVF